MRRPSSDDAASVPTLAYLSAFFLAPVVLFLLLSFTSSQLLPGPPDAPTLDSYRRLFSAAYLRVLGQSLGFATLVALSSLVCAVALAEALAGVRGLAKVALIFLVVLPSWLNVLVKNYSWMLILGRNGLVNDVLLSLGLVPEPTQYLFTRAAVVIGLVHTYLPFAVLPVIIARDRIGPDIYRAALDLGAPPLRRFVSVTLPLLRPGMLAGFVLTFIPALGAFITPDILGGGRGMMIATLLENQVLVVNDWPFASALGATLMLFVFGCFCVVYVSVARSRGRSLELL